MSITQTAIDAAIFYVRKGISKDAAVALISVLWYESKLKPGSQGSQSTETPGALNPAGAYGIASWNGSRQLALSTYATKKDLPVGELDTQLAFVLTEMANSYPKSWAAINQPGLTYSQIIPTIVAEYENPKDHPKEIAGAMEEAPELMTAVTATLAAAPVTPPTPTPAPLPWPLPLPSTGVQTTMPVINPALITTLVQLFAPIAESLVSGIVKGIITQIAAMEAAQAKAGTVPTFPTLPGLDPNILASIQATIQASIAAEIAKFNPTTGVK